MNLNFIKIRQRCWHTHKKTGINYTNKHNFLYDSFSVIGTQRTSKFRKFASVGRQKSAETNSHLADCCYHGSS